MSQKVLPGQLTVEVARSLRGFATPRCTTHPQRQPGPTSAITSGLSAGREAEGERRHPHDSVPKPQFSDSRDGPSQNLAPYLGGGESQIRNLFLVPAPQDDVQWVQALQLPHPPVSESTKRIQCKQP